MTKLISALAAIALLAASGSASAQYTNNRPLINNNIATPRAPILSHQSPSNPYEQQERMDQLRQENQMRMDHYNDQQQQQQMDDIRETQQRLREYLNR